MSKVITLKGRPAYRGKAEGYAMCCPNSIQGWAGVEAKTGKIIESGHVHEGESETYVILKGHGVYNDNGTEVEVSIGDVTYCAPGEGHGLVNNSDEELVLVALIIYDKR